MKIPAKMIEGLDTNTSFELPVGAIYYATNDAVHAGSLFPGTWEYLGTHEVTFSTGTTGSTGETADDETLKIPDDMGTTTTLIIHTAAELRAFRDGINDGSVALTQNAVLVADINLADDDGNATQWEPIGRQTGATALVYAGIFDGMGHTINGYKIEVTDSTDGVASTTYDWQYIGFFANVSGTVRNTIFAGDVSINLSTSDAATAGVYVGGVAGYASGSILHCKNAGQVTNTQSAASSQRSTGGVCGVTESTGVLQECVNSGAVTVSVDTSIYCGGVCGNSRADTTAVFSNMNLGTVRATFTGTAVKQTTIGGVYGYGNARNCVNTGNVTGICPSTLSASTYTGGVVALTESTVQYCANTGAVYGGGKYTGGVVGAVLTSSYLFARSCSNTGSVSAAESTQYAGGIAGFLQTQSGTTYKSTAYDFLLCASVAITGTGICGDLVGLFTLIQSTQKGYLSACQYCGTKAVGSGTMTLYNTSNVSELGDVVSAVLPEFSVGVDVDATAQVLHCYPSDVSDTSEYISYGSFVSLDDTVVTPQYESGAFSIMGVGGGSTQYEVSDVTLTPSKFQATSAASVSLGTMSGWANVSGSKVETRSRTLYAWERVL